MVNPKKSCFFVFFFFFFFFFFFLTCEPVFILFGISVKMEDGTKRKKLDDGNANKAQWQLERKKK